MKLTETLAATLVSISLMQTYAELSNQRDICKAEGFPGQHETWKLTRKEEISTKNSLVTRWVPVFPDHVYYVLSCDTSNWLNDYSTNKYLIDADPTGADNWNCGNYRQSVIWGCNTTNGSWTSWRNLDYGRSDFDFCMEIKVAVEDIPLRDECCIPWSDFNAPVKQPTHCIATCLWYLLRDPENGYRKWDIKRNPYTMAPQGTDVLYLCNDGYHIVGDPHVKCTENGNWTSIPVCKEDTLMMKKFYPLFVVAVWFITSFVAISLVIAYSNRDSYTSSCHHHYQSHFRCQ